MISGHICLMKQKKVFALQKSSTPTGLIWYTNMADFSLFRYTNMADMTSRENALLDYVERNCMVLIYHRLPGWSPTRLPTSTSATTSNNICLCPRELPSLPYWNTRRQLHCSGNLLSHLLFPTWCGLLLDAN